MGAPVSFMEKFDSHFDVLSAIDTRSTVMVEALAMAATTQYDKILATMAELKTLSITESATTGRGNCDIAKGRITLQQTHQVQSPHQLIDVSDPRKMVPG